MHASIEDSVSVNLALRASQADKVELRYNSNPPKTVGLGRFMIGVVEDERAGTSLLEARPIHSGTEACGSRSPRDGGRNPVRRTSNHGSLTSQCDGDLPGPASRGKRKAEEEEGVDAHILLLSEGERKYGVSREDCIFTSVSHA